MYAGGSNILMILAVPFSQVCTKNKLTLSTCQLRCTEEEWKKVKIIETPYPMRARRFQKVRELKFAHYIGVSVRLFNASNMVRDENPT